VARDTQALPVAYVVPLAPLANGLYVVSLGLLWATADATAFSTRPSVSSQYSLPPRSVSL